MPRDLRSFNILVYFLKLSRITRSILPHHEGSSPQRISPQSDNRLMHQLIYPPLQRLRQERTSRARIEVGQYASITRSCRR